MKKIVITIVGAGEVTKEELQQFGQALEITFPKAKKISIEVRELVTEEKSTMNITIK